MAQSFLLFSHQYDPLLTDMSSFKKNLTRDKASNGEWKIRLISDISKVCWPNWLKFGQTIRLISLFDLPFNKKTQVSYWKTEFNEKNRINGEWKTKLIGDISDDCAKISRIFESFRSRTENESGKIFESWEWEWEFS